MLLNAIWQVPEENKCHSLPDRSIMIDREKSGYYECAVLGKIEDYADVKDGDYVLIREQLGEHDIVVAIADTPFVVEFVDTANDESFSLMWDGFGWSTAKAIEQEDLDKYCLLPSVDAEVIAAMVLDKLGLTHINSSMLRERHIHLELVRRDDFTLLNLPSDQCFYRSTDSREPVYTADIKTLPPLAELDLLHCTGETTDNTDVIYIFHDEDEDIAHALKMLGKTDLHVGLLDTEDDDIVDQMKTVEGIVAYDQAPMHLYVLKHDTEQASLRRLYINMGMFYPELTKYLSP